MSNPNGKDRCFFKGCGSKGKYEITYDKKKVMVCKKHKLYDGIWWDANNNPRRS